MPEILLDKDCIEIRKMLFEGRGLSSLNYDQLVKMYSYLRVYSAFCSKKEEYSEALRSNAFREAIADEIRNRDSSLSERTFTDSNSSADDSGFEREWE
jgi:hypothetical protein